MQERMLGGPKRAGENEGARKAMREYIISVMSRDRPGIVAAVSGAAAKLGGNITHLSETVLRGYFTMIMSVEAPDGLELETLRGALAIAGQQGEFEVGVLPFEPEPARREPGPDIRERFILTARCRDQRGIIHRISSTLADAGINIDDFYAYVHERELIMILEIGVTPGTMVEHVQSEMAGLARETGVTIHLQHIDIFRATTDLQAVLRLGDKR
jgi:glycine cleavage system transcriptional repressor